MSKKHRIAVLRETITKVTRILAGRGIRVTQSGMNAFVQYHEVTLEPTRVNIPYLPDDASDDLISAIEGFVDHEVGHLLFSDAKVIVDAQKNGVGSLHNIVEDVFIERKMCGAFSGTAYNLGKMYHIFTEKFIQPKFVELCRDSSKTEFDYWNQLCACAIRALGGQEHFAEYMKDKWALLPKVKEVIEPLSERICTSNDSWENLQIAIELRDAIYGEKKPKEESPKEEYEEPDFDDESPDSEDEETDFDDMPEDDIEEEEVDEHEEDGEDPDDEEIDDEEPVDDEGEEEIEDEEASDDGVPSEHASDSEPETIEDARDCGGAGGGESEIPEEDGTGDAVTPFESEDIDGDIAKIEDFDDGMGELISEMAGESISESSYMPFTKDWDYIGPYEVPESYNGRWAESIASKVDGMTGSLQKGLERAFRAANKARWEGGKKSGRINNASLSRLLNNDPRVFRTREEIKTKEVAVTLLIDCSGSMSGSRIQVATEASWALSEVLNKLNINFEVIGFTTHDGRYHLEEYSDMYEEMRKAGRDWSRVEPIYMPIFKAFGERFGVEQKKRLACVPREVGLANNVDGECLQYAADRLLKQKEPGKTIIVLSDGQPCACGSTYGFINDLKSKIKDLEKKINIVGIGIQTNAVRDYYKKNVVINEINDLPNTVLAQLRDAIMQK